MNFKAETLLSFLTLKELIIFNVIITVNTDTNIARLSPASVTTRLSAIFTPIT